MNVKKEIGRYRRRIDRVDRRVARLLAKRFLTVVRIGRMKRESNSEVRDEARENEVLGRINAVVEGEDARRYVRTIFGGIIDTKDITQFDVLWLR